MTLTDWEEGRKAYLLSVLSPAQGQLNAANCIFDVTSSYVASW